MAAIQRMDEMVKDYLLFRGLNATLRALETELKNEKDKGFRVDKVVDQLQSYVSSYELVALRDYWSYLDQRVFSRLEQVYASSVRKLEVSLLKFYVVNAVQSGRSDKVSEFFEKMASELQHQSEWKEWFVLPFIRTPEESNTFAVYFTRQWQETFLVSLHNFFSVIFQSMPVPALLNFEEDARRLTRLQEENNLYRKQLGKALERRDVELLLRQVEVIENGNNIGGSGGPFSMDLMDDFFVISQDTTIEEHPEPKTNQIRSFIKNIGLPSSPIVGKKSSPNPALAGKRTAGSKEEQNQQRAKPKDGASAKVKGKPTPGPSTAASTSGLNPNSSNLAIKDETDKSQRSEGGGQVKVKEKVELETDEQTQVVMRNKTAVEGRSFAGHPQNVEKEETSRPEVSESMPSSFVASDSVASHSASVAADIPDGGGFLLLSQEDYREHRSSIIQCCFSQSGHAVATSDVDGVVKVWGLQPSPVTMATVMSKSMLLSLEWVGPKERMLLLGNKAGSVRLFDIIDKKTLKEATVDPNFPRIISISSNPTGSSFVVSAAVRGRGGGKLSIWDLNLMKPKQNLQLLPTPTAVNYSCHNRNGNLILTGAADGVVRLFDVRKSDSIASWVAHTGDVYTALFSQDESACYSMGADGKFMKWSLRKRGTKVADLGIHQGACGPFVLTGAAGYRQVQTPKGKLFALDFSGDHVLTCAQNGGLIYKLSDNNSLARMLTLGGHKTPVVCVDWSSTQDCHVCLSGAMDGQVRVSTLLPQ